MSSTYGSSTLLPDFYDDTDCLIKSETSTPCHRLQGEPENSGIGSRLSASRYYFKYVNEHEAQQLCCAVNFISDLVTYS